MGLDNRIVLKIHNCTPKIKEALKSAIDSHSYNMYFEDLRSHSDESGDYKTLDLCYWREWWGLRNILVYKLNGGSLDYSEPKYTLNKSDLVYVRDLLVKCIIDPEELDGYTSGHWEFNECYDQVMFQIIRLSWVIKVLFGHDNYGLTEEEVEFRNLIAGKWEIYFYDSY